jgi:hypothetical protein
VAPPNLHQLFTRHRTLAWLGHFRRLIVRYERQITAYTGFFHIASYGLCPADMAEGFEMTSSKYYVYWLSTGHLSRITVIMLSACTTASLQQTSSLEESRRGTGLSDDPEAVVASI